MAKTWYPVIDYLACLECGMCVTQCPHGVYDTAKAPSPVVQNPQACIDHCHGCGNRCPAGAITYVGEDTGWNPPCGELRETEPCCAGGCCEPSRCSPTEKTVLVEYLYLDLKTCDRCIGTDQVLDEVMVVLTPALQLAGYTVDYRKIEMATAALATQHQFLSSPTVRVNGQDICGPVKENSCGCCGEISGCSVDCRVFEFEGGTYEVPPQKMMAEAILRTIFTKPTDCNCGKYRMPENLVNFFNGKSGKSASSCKCC